MSLQLSNSLFFRQKNEPHFKHSCFSRVSASSEAGAERVTTAKSASVSEFIHNLKNQKQCFDEARERIVKLIHKPPQLSISTFDTAWIAMVPSPHSSQEPCFPNCVNWLLENQCQDGSWARPHHHSLLQKDVLSSTLACILALKRWGVGEEQIIKGTHFIELNFALASNKYQISPMGFDIIFPGMLEYARELSLNINLEQETLNELIHKRNLELKRCCQSHSFEMEAYMAYLSEGLMGKLQNWKSLMKYQRKNGSLFNSPSTTAAAYIFHHNNDGCLDYLHSVLNKFGINAVPAVYPLNIYAQLSTIDNLEKLGISQYFRNDIQIVMDETYRCWLQEDEEIFADASTCALAFRLLRMNGYDVSSDMITKNLEKECISDAFGGHMRDMNRTLELYKASEIIFPDEVILEKEHLRLKHLLEQEQTFHSSDQLNSNIGQDQVKHVLEYPFYAVVERVANRRNIEQHHNSDNTRILKTSFSSSNFGDKDSLFLSVADFNNCQKIHSQELKELERWVIEKRLDELKFARCNAAYCFFSTAATVFSPELCEARMSVVKSILLATAVDDFFDVGGSYEELKNLIHLVEKWDVDLSTECSSKNVFIIFSALKSTISEIVDQALVIQERSVKKHIIDLWLDLFNRMLKENEWVRDSYVPTMDEYMNNAYVSFALGPIVLPSLYLIGPKLSEEHIRHSEYHNLYKLMSTCGRLLNDIQSYKRELKDGKLNAVPLYIINGGDEITEEAAIVEMKKLNDRCRRELHKLVLEGKNSFLPRSVVLEGKNSFLPRSIKDQFWHMCTIVHLFYSKDDGFTSEKFINLADKIIYEPIVLPNL